MFLFLTSTMCWQQSYTESKPSFLFPSRRADVCIFRTSVSYDPILLNWKAAVCSEIMTKKFASSDKKKEALNQIWLQLRTTRAAATFQLLFGCVSELRHLCWQISESTFMKVTNSEKSEIRAGSTKLHEWVFLFLSQVGRWWWWCKLMSQPQTIK